MTASKSYRTGVLSVSPNNSSSAYTPHLLLHLLLAVLESSKRREAHVSTLPLFQMREKLSSWYRAHASKIRNGSPPVGRVLHLCVS
jgi:hypothetical protein